MAISLVWEELTKEVMMSVKWSSIIIIIIGETNLIKVAKQDGFYIYFLKFCFFLNVQS